MGYLPVCDIAIVHLLSAHDTWIRIDCTDKLLFGNHAMYTADGHAFSDWSFQMCDERSSVI